MKTTSRNKEPISKRDMYYYRRRYIIRVFQRIAAKYTEFVESNGLTQKEVAKIARQDPGRMSKRLSDPKNLTLETISDLLLAMDTEMSDDIVPLNSNIVKLKVEDKVAKIIWPASQPLHNERTTTQLFEIKSNVTQ